MIFKTEPGWVLEKVSGSGWLTCTRWALLMTTERMKSSEVDLLWVCEEHHGCSLSSSSLTSKANVVRSQEDSHLFSIVFVDFDCDQVSVMIIFRLYDILADSYCYCYNNEDTGNADNVSGRTKKMSSSDQS